jgi:DNA-binding NtrC family response regulator
MKRRVLIVDDDASIRETLAHQLGRSGKGHDVTLASSAESALSMLHSLDPAVVVTDVRMPGMHGIELVRRIRESVPDLCVIVMTAFEDMRTAIEAMKAGAFDYVVKPLDLDHLELLLDRAINERRLRQRVQQESRDSSASFQLDALTGRDPRMIAIYKRIGALATSRASVLIRGETGTGKEVIARAIHFNSDRAGEPFVAVNCSAVPETLLESEMFGHMRGAFTGALSTRRGRFEIAGAGTIFLDEIGDVSPAFQAKLLRVLQEREFTPVGSERSRSTDARVIAATNRPLEEMIRRGAFREDLYYRLNVVDMVVPPLRERRGDVPLLVAALIERIAAEQHREGIAVTPSAMRRLVDYDWPGNVRELENELVRAVSLSPSGVIAPQDLALRGLTAAPSSNGQDDAGRLTLADVERAHIERVLALAGGNKRKAARILRVTRPRFDRLLARHGIVVTQRGQRGAETVAETPGRGDG